MEAQRQPSTLIFFNTSKVQSSELRTRLSKAQINELNRLPTHWNLAPAQMQTAEVRVGGLELIQVAAL